MTMVKVEVSSNHKMVHMWLIFVIGSVKPVKMYRYLFSILMEYMPDGDLESKIKENGRLNPNLAFFLLFQVVKALFSLRGIFLI